MRSLDVCWRAEDPEYFFGSYDKTPWATVEEEKTLLMHRIQGESVAIFRLYLDKVDGRCIGESAAWNHQQGSMTQWLADENIAYNDIQDAELGTQLVNVKTGEKQFIPWPIQAVHPSETEALSLNYKRLHEQRPEYGYNPQVSNFSSDMSLGEDGLWRVNLETGESELILSLSQLRNYRPRTEMENARHRVNHAMFSPGGTRVVFMHRWTGSEGKFSRLYVTKRNGDELRLLMDDRMVSHYSWRDENHLVVWGRTEEFGDHYYLIDVRDGTADI